MFKRILAFILILSISFSVQVNAALEKEIVIRVAVLAKAEDFVLKIRGSFEIFDLVKHKRIASGSRLKPNQVKKTWKGLAIGAVQFTSDRLEIRVSRDASIYINKRRLRGTVTIIADKEGKLTVVNNIELEDYVKGVLYHEISHKWPIEAIKAQAVATRTYAIYSAGNRTKYDFDVTNDIYSQVYGGKDSERYRTNIGVDRTRNEVLVYADKILPAFFHADSGGHTEDVSEVWDLKIPPLSGVPSPFSKDSPHRKWRRNFRLKDIQEKLVAKGYKIGLIKDIEVLERNKSGRIKMLKITDRTDQSMTINGKDFRLIVGPNDIRSNNYEIIMQGYFVDIVGKGWGHGVGLDQWGARGMAQRRYDYKQILEYYYPGSELTDVRLLK